MKNIHPFVRKTLAWSVHLFTATGVIWGFLSLRAIITHEWKLAIMYMTVALIVDGTDGIFARWFDVKTYANGLNGTLLDSIIDYLNTTVVPALFLVEANLLPKNLGVPCAVLILITSTYQFTQIDAKTDATNEYFFKGFPVFWDIVTVFMMVLRLDQWFNFGLLIVLNILIFVPIKYVYPTRTARLKKLTLTITYLYGLLGLIGVLLYPNEPKWIWWVILTYFIYYVSLSLWLYNHPTTLNEAK
ncbi:MAG: phosphatidylcholine synthase [Chloroflexi bacterium]|nr:phosphatidylcholine synthase [Chloroflexota bacterium]